MKKTCLAVGMWFMILIALASPGTAQAGDVFLYKGEGAGAIYDVRDATGCIRTLLIVGVTDNRRRTPPGSAEERTFQADVNYSLYDHCNNVPLVDIRGVAPLTDQDFRIQGNLISAALNTTVAAFDYVAGTPVAVVIDFNWTRSGALDENWNEQFHLHEMDLIINTHHHGKSRPAAASGSVSINGANVIPGPVTVAFMFRGSDVSVQIHK